jgi:hypothetical protein
LPQSDQVEEADRGGAAAGLGGEFIGEVFGPLRVM